MNDRESEHEAVLFIHSTGTGPRLWTGVASSAIGERRRLHPANLGYPPNPPIERGTRVTAAEDAAHVLDAVPADVERVHLVAHSYGALVALHLIPALAGRLASVFLFEPVVFGALRNDADVEAEAAAEARSFVAHPWFLHDETKGGREEWLELFVDYWSRPGSWSKMPEAVREASRALGWKMFQEVRSCFFDETPFDSWTIPVPATIMTGDRSPLASRAMARGLTRGRANVALVETRDIGHMAPLTHPRPVHAELAGHFDRLSSPRAR